MVETNRNAVLPAVTKLGPATEAEDGTSLSPSDASAEEEDLARQAAHLELSLPTLARSLFATDHPLADLPLSQLRLCSLLLREGRRTMSQIGDELGISVSAVTQMADRLEKAGMVERAAAPGGDRRTRYLQLTEHGDGLMRSRREQRTARARDVLAQIPPPMRAQALEALDALIDACRHAPARRPFFEAGREAI